MRRLLILVVLILVLFSINTVGTGKAGTDKPDEPFVYVRVYADPKGHSHFSNETISFSLHDYAPPLKPISVSAPFKTENMVFISNPQGWQGDWHPAPRKQFIFVLTGEYELEVSDGDVRRFGPGSVVLVEDITGKGHRTKNVSKDRGCVVAVPLDKTN